jgi:hypothetical protein
LSEGVAYPICLGTKEDDRYKLFDGVHRAIKLTRQGNKSITVLYRA